MWGSMQREGGRGSCGSCGGRLLSLFLSAPFLILLFQSRGRVCSAGRCAWQCWTWVADGRQGTGATGRLWFFELILVHVCVYICVCVVFHWPIFWVVGFTCVAMRAGLGPPSHSDVDLVCLIPALPPPPSYRHTCAHTHPRRQTVQVHSDIQHTLLSCMLAHTNMHIIMVFTHMNTLSFLHIEKCEQPDPNICAHTHSWYNQMQ